jgi:hypothetical protein
MTLREQYYRIVEDATAKGWSVTFRNRGGKHYVTMKGVGTHAEVHQFASDQRMFCTSVGYFNPQFNATIRLNPDIQY